MKIAFDRNLVCRKILFSEISGDLLAFILKKNSFNKETTTFSSLECIEPFNSMFLQVGQKHIPHKFYTSGMD